ncbi:MAG: hypothetical protein GY867_09315 [bacterium]|nr:hypothetical protein [bacterium]
MSIGGDDIAQARHYGTEFVMVDYKTKATSLYANANFVPSQRLHLFTTLSYHKSTAEYDPVEMPDITDKLEGDLTHQDFSFDHMHEYSNHDFGSVNLALGFGYLIAAQTTFTFDLEYADLTDDSGTAGTDPYYVYGDESGSWYMIRSGLKFDF